MIHQPSEYFFLYFYYDPDDCYYPEYSPGEETEVFYYSHSEQLTSWHQVHPYVIEWLSYLKREFEAPDLWLAISEDNKLADAALALDLNDTPFNPQELKYISNGINEIRHYIASTQSLSADQVAFANSRLDYLEQASRRQGRQAWVHTSIGVLFTIVVGTALAPNAARELFRFVASVLSQVLTAPLQLP